MAGLSAPLQVLSLALAVVGLVFAFGAIMLIRPMWTEINRLSGRMEWLERQQIPVAPPAPAPSRDPGKGSRA